MDESKKTTAEAILDKLAIVTPDGGATVRELAGWTKKSETAVRDNLKNLVAQGRVTKEGSTYAMTDTQTTEAPEDEAPEAPADDDAPRKRGPRATAAAERDERVLAVIKANPQGLAVEGIARQIDAPDLDSEGWSPSTYLSVRRLRESGLVSRSVVWRADEAAEG